MSGHPRRIVLADDHPLFRDGLRALLSSIPSTEIVGEATSGDEAVELALEREPEVVVMDLHMPGLGGVEATRRITGAAPHIGVLVLTMIEDDDAVFAAMRAGARGYLLKGSNQSEILAAIAAVGTGEAVFGPLIAERLIAYFSTAGRGAANAFPQLTEREREVLEQIARGRSNHDIARLLSLSEKTIRNHASSIFTKLQVADRAEAIVKAREAGVGAEPGSAR